MNPPANFNIETAKNIIKDFESLELKAYQDGGGVWTIGYGTTVGVKPGDVITLEQAEKFLHDDCTKVFLPFMCRVIKVELKDHEWNALLSFCYNVGGPRFQTSTLLQKLNGGAPKKYVAMEFVRWVYDNRVLTTGLIKRRFREGLLFLGP